MSGRVLLTTGAVCGALALLGACSFGTASDDSAPPPDASVSQPPPVGSIEHPRPVECLDGRTAGIGSPLATGTAPDGGKPAAGSTPISGRPPSSGSSPSSGTRNAPGTPAHRPADDVRIGPLLWQGLRTLETGDQHAHGAQNSGGWHYRLSARLEAGTVVTVTIGAEQRARAGLEYGGGYGNTPAPAVTFHSCTAAATSFSGGFFVAGDGRACVPVDVKVGDAPVQHVVISFFQGRCPA
ncbi:hypothetical protein [Streptomyces sp. NPDC020917]|uniref:hypothetical protein n=1 Tax=Streptomyces sp. NPDC020917 TaxID=3365102 RepID=UPI0037A74DA7